jgi:hypothetical protein
MRKISTWFSGQQGERVSFRFGELAESLRVRALGATIALGVTTMGIGALPILFSKKRRHYLTINFKGDEGKDQAAIFELGKDTTRTLLATLAARTGKTVEYEDDEARKSENK